MKGTSGARIKFAPMTLTEIPATAPAPEDPVSDPRRRRLLTLSLYGVAFLAWWLVIGLPTDPMVAFGWLWLATIAWNSDRPWREHLRFARDWVPVLILLVLYDFSRGFADRLWEPHITAMIRADEALFGGVPTVWLQEHLYRPGHVHWWDVLVSWVYFSHFVVSLGVAVVLWLRSRALWAAFMRRWFFLTAAGLLTYFAFPAAPPWYASKYGYLPETVYRISGEGWNAIGLHGAGKLLNVGQALSNPVAAMPSLHSGFAMLVVAFFFSRVRRRWIPLLLLYPLAMTFSLVYSGEHYVIDVLVGWSYVLITLLVVGSAERWWRRRQPKIQGSVHPRIRQST
jgi:membrane-associated phospholipid phosphatase